MSTWATPVGAVNAFGSSVIDVSAPQRASAQPALGGSNQEPPPPPPLSRDQKLLFLRLDEALRDMEDTEAGRSKKWRNVQPCVSELGKCLIQSAANHEDTLLQLTAQLRDMQNHVAVLARDQRLKEDRHRLEEAERQRGREELLTYVGRLSDTLDAREKENGELRGAVHELLSRVARLEGRVEGDGAGSSRLKGDVDESRQTADVERSAGDAGEGGGRAPGQGRRRQGSRRCLSDGDAEDAARSADLVADLHQRVLAEVAELRVQWERFARAQANGADQRRHETHTSDDEDGASSDTSSGCLDRAPALRLSHPAEAGKEAESHRRRRGRRHEVHRLPLPVSLSFALFPPQMARWVWSGSGASHFSTATRRRRHDGAQQAERNVSFLTGPTSHLPGQEQRQRGASPAIAFDDVRLLDGRSGCWYSAGAWPCAMLSSSPARSSPFSGESRRRQQHRDGGDTDYLALGEDYWQVAAAWGCYDWERPAAIRVTRTGVYRFTLSLLTTCPTAPALSRGGGGACSPLRRNPSPALRRSRSPVATAATSSLSRPSGPTLALYVDGGRVLTSSGASAVTSAVVFVDASDTSGDKRMSKDGGRCDDRGCCCRAAGDRGRRPRPCCGPAQWASYTVSEYCRLEAGSELQVRCHNHNDTTATVEGFLELEYVV